MWDDTGTEDAVGGRCLNSWQARRRMNDNNSTLEEVIVQLSFDEHISGELSQSKLRLVAVNPPIK